MPPAVALFTYKRSLKTLRIFPQTGIFRGFSLKKETAKLQWAGVA
jgi:hypothetical protein